MYKEMANIYRKTPTENLKVLRSKKAARLMRLRREGQGYFNKKEIEALEHNIHQIDVELTARFYQMSLPK